MRLFIIQVLLWVLETLPEQAKVACQFLSCTSNAWLMHMAHAWLMLTLPYEHDYHYTHTPAGPSLLLLLILTNQAAAVRALAQQGWARHADDE